MKTQLRVGIVLGFVLLVATPIFANSIRETQDLRARLSLTDSRTNTEILVFTSTSSANDAMHLMQGQGNTLSFSSFGRVPFYQTLKVSNVVGHSTNASSLPASSVPEPTSLLLLGSGLTALAVGLRKRRGKQ